MVKCPVDYEPVNFLRCHSKNQDAADIQTQVWDCLFEPCVRDSSETTSVVATCGGRSVCFIDCITGQVRSKYYTPNLNELLFSLSWTTVEINSNPQNILATGGSKCIIHVLNHVKSQCILTHSLKISSAKSIGRIQFHPLHPYHLFCGTSDGDLRIFKLLINDSDSCSLNLLQHVEGKSEIFDFTFCIKTNLLFSSCNDGLFVYFYPSEESFSDKNVKRGKVLLPENPNPSLRSVTKLVDSVEVLANGLVACKCALHGAIYIFDAAKLLNQLGSKSGTLCKVDLSSTLIWSKTDNYFMYMGVSAGADLLACGDDKGALWLYNTSSLQSKQDLSPFAILPWPKLTDTYNDKKRKLDLQVYDIVVDKVAVHSSGLYLVAVTNNNMVCIWKRV